MVKYIGFMLQGRVLFEKRDSPPRSLSQKLSQKRKRRNDKRTLSIIGKPNDGLAVFFCHFKVAEGISYGVMNVADCYVGLL